MPVTKVENPLGFSSRSATATAQIGNLRRGTPVYDFTWRGKSAHADFGIDTLKIGSTVIAERRDNAYTIAGRSGLVHNQDGAVEEVERQLTIYLPYEQGRAVAPFSEIRAWLKGYGQLTLSTIPDRYMLAYITDQIALDPIIEGYADRKGTVIFRCAPYLYHTGVEEETLLEPRVLQNPGTAQSQPIITVNATGDVDLMIGTQSVLLTGLTGQIIIDSAIEEAYGCDENGELVNLSNHMAGDFPILPTGSVPINWSASDGDDEEEGSMPGTVTSIVIQPNWRDEN